MTVIVLEELEAGATERTEVAVRECPMCHALVPVGSIPLHQDYHRRLRA